MPQESYYGTQPATVARRNTEWTEISQASGRVRRGKATNQAHMPPAERVLNGQRTVMQTEMKPGMGKGTLRRGRKVSGGVEIVAVRLPLVPSTGRK